MKRNGDNIFISYYFGPPDNSLGIAWSSLDSENNLTEWCQETSTTLVQNAKETGLVVNDKQNPQALIIGAGDGNGVRLGGINADP